MNNNNNNNEDDNKNENRFSVNSLINIYLMNFLIIIIKKMIN
jgi:hypothetical protein